MATGKSLEIIPRWNTDRGNADHDWLKTSHTSVAIYQDYEHSQFGSLRVFNEDPVQPRSGFGTHSHREFDILCFVVSGEHKDSMNHIEILKRGDLQLASAGSPGISHCHGPKASALHADQDTPVEIPPASQCTVVVPVGSECVSLDRDAKGPVPLQSPISLFATLLSPGTSLPSVFPEKLVVENADETKQQRKKYVHIVQTGGYNPGEAKGASVRLSGNGKGNSEVVLREAMVHISLVKRGKSLFLRMLEIKLLK